MQLHDHLTALATPGKSGRLTVALPYEDLARHYDVCRKTIQRDFARLQECEYIRTVGRKTVREADGGFVLPVIRPTDPDREKWLRMALLRGEPPAQPAGVVVDIAGGSRTSFPLYQGCGCCRCWRDGQAALMSRRARRLNLLTVRARVDFEGGMWFWMLTFMPVILTRADL